MDVALPLDKMSIPDKLRLMEELWGDLCRTPENIPSPTWHDDVLRAREKRFEEGKTSFEDWDEAKRRLREELS